MEMQKLSAHEFVKVSSIGLEKMVKDIAKLKQSLSKVLSVNTMSMLYKKIYSLEQEVNRLQHEIKTKATEELVTRRRYDNSIEEVERLREENFQLKTQLNVLEEERFEEYKECLSFVAICLTIIWHASMKDDCIESMIARETIVKFLEFVTQSLESFAESNIDGSLHSPPNKIYDSSSDEYNLVSSMIGIITNIAATPLGRDYLSSKTLGVKTLDSLIMYLPEMPTRQCHTIKNLILKSLFNVSINQTGLKYLSTKKGLMTNLGYLFTEETESELRLSCLNCIQSLIVEPDNPSFSHELLEVVSMRRLQEIADTSKGELKKVILEVMSDLNEVLSRQS
ncbi:heat shock factor 2-binding protein-like [Xenia sp. Carnegie-2017]|uniref:heat shock factor 2-binding protein-like n=1 Tax=Xenia sp. Carnegie-2017 TaxID=2897299 RepID=UPI001F04860B|nr:heat shock factor 2-binding protein-like [Xenia sp. Carnegie-2017]